MISHHHKSVFVHIPKCGGQSIETLFLDELGLNWATRAPLLLRPNETAELGPPRLAHLLAQEYTRFHYLTPDQFDNYYKFTVVRNPYARVVSAYNYLPINRFGRFGPKISFDRFILKWLPQQFELVQKYSAYPHEYSGYYWFLRPQSDYILSSNGDILVDDILHLERIQDEIDTVYNNCGLSTKLRHVNASRQHKRRTQDLREEHFAVINELYGADFDTLGYARSEAALITS